MVNWQVTLTTVYCDVISDEVTIIVAKDLSARCTACQPTSVSLPGQRTKESSANRAFCEGPECRLVIQYREKLLSEERQQASTWQ